MLKVRLHSENGVIPVDRITGWELLAFFTPENSITLLGEFEGIKGKLNLDAQCNRAGAWLGKWPPTTAAKLLISHVESEDFLVERLFIQVPKSDGRWVIISKDSPNYVEFGDWSFSVLENFSSPDEYK